MKKGNTILKLCIGLMAVIFMLGVGALPAQAEVVFLEGFESGWGLWSTDNGVWEVGTPTAGPPSCYNGSQCAGTVLSGNYPSQTDSRLVSPSITLPAVTGDEEIYFSFRQWFSYAANDGGYVQISVYDDATGTWSGWSNMGTAISDGSPIWSLKSLRAGVLTGLGGKKIRIAFYHTAASWGEPGSESTGWYIDDIEIVKKVPEFTGDFEAGWGDWSADSGVWEVGTPAAGPPSCYNGSQCAGTVLSGNYPSQTDSRLVSPSIVLPAVTGGDEIHLRFWQWFSYAANDGGYVQISVYDDATGTWSAWANIGNPIVNNSSVWTPFDFDITAYAGKKIRIAFYHTAASWGEPGSESTGWYIDDITISTPLITFYCDNDNDGYISSSPSGTCTGRVMTVMTMIIQFIPVHRSYAMARTMTATLRHLMVQEKAGMA
jgi:bacillopeptidase F (M6 metalloprotease family)